MDGSQINTDENYSTELDDADITNALIKSLRDLPEVSNKIINSVP